MPTSTVIQHPSAWLVDVLFPKSDTPCIRHLQVERCRFSSQTLLPLFRSAFSGSTVVDERIASCLRSNSFASGGNIDVVMTKSEPLSFDSAVAHLCSDEWAPSGTHVATRHSDEILQALLPASRTDEGRAALGAAPGAIENLVCVLRNPLVFHEKLGELAIRILRNICARSVPNQGRTAQCGAHDLVLNCIARRFEFCDNEGAGADAAAVRRVEEDDGVDHHRMRLPFFGFAVEFLVNFVTCNVDNAELVWRKAFPEILEKLLECDNHAAASAAAALVHNCIAIVPDRMTDIVRIWSEVDGDGKSLTRSLVQQMKNVSDSPEHLEKFSWSFMIIRRLIGASLLENSFEALGPSLDRVMSSSAGFSEHQETFLHILDAAASKSAENPGGDGNDLAEIVIPDNSIGFFGELLEAAMVKKSGDVLRTAGSIVGSVIIVCEDSAKLDELRVRSVKVAVKVLHALAGNEDSGGEAAARSSSDDMIKLDNAASLSGLRGVMIRTIAICCDLAKEAQDSVRKLQGIPLVLSALSYEKDSAKNPFLREWAILCIRNLTLGNTANAEEISSYELADIQNDSELLEKTGLEAFMDEKTGRPRLRVKSKENI